MRYAVVKVTRSESSKRVSDFAPWEVPILELVHGAENVVVVGEKDVEREYPDPAAEYERLAVRYKSAEGQEAPYVRDVYGIGPGRLAKAIQDVREDEKTRPPEEFIDVATLDPANRAYLAAEAKQLEADRQEIDRKRAEALAEVQAAAQSEKEALDAQAKQLAADRAKFESERAEFAAALDAATGGAPAATVATPISE